MKTLNVSIFVRTGVTKVFLITLNAPYEWRTCLKDRH